MTQMGVDYVKSVERQLAGSRKQKKDYLKKLTADVAERLEEAPELDTAALASAFGSPEELAQDFMETLETAEIKKAFTWKHIVLIGVIAALVIWLGVAAAAFIDAHINNHGTGVEYIGDSIISTEEY